VLDPYLALWISLLVGIATKELGNGYIWQPIASLTHVAPRMFNSFMIEPLV